MAETQQSLRKVVFEKRAGSGEWRWVETRHRCVAHHSFKAWPRTMNGAAYHAVASLPGLAPGLSGQGEPGMARKAGR